MVSAASARGALAAAALVAFAAGAAAQDNCDPSFWTGDCGLLERLADLAGPRRSLPDLVVSLLNTTGLGEWALASFA